ncbi:bifunctional DNA-formamidopyrimidine glycosylase/DNA-(apurinic or apyrimidinic site) lyase [Acetobacter thailandicus]|uniref:bifunctional DNA-formamidopyrimidine glycosylase/DNA-(apurinic or apyrimidinic site) lyase n=1 Tax=Acetobacter thailandicus TaxID=1502842 RepID=UPI001BAC6694|nr:bifunctional DNA-formamidopyrimidine glycosylase/DNA-(apurinic or apyrimidinic site) lyase [Acetobacter thailandicus]MBS0959679.1 bifunctional DNA-formamidopyrimidine glycosylase/DNA-(apurinic or apyrimidinic site) lyase [Acetobacter thailandicus]
MPELPEVETVIRGMQSALQNRIIQTAIVKRHDLRRQIPADFTRRVKGKTVKNFQRRGKYILIRLSGNLTIIMHLGMSGRITLDSQSHDGKHDHVVFITDDDKACVFTDPRRFGFVDLIHTADEEQYSSFRAMGPEPLSSQFTWRTLADAFRNKNSPVKTALLDQGNVAGLGNIYVCEALFYAGIDPRTPAGNLTAQQLRPLVTAIRKVLNEAIAAGGSSLKDYVRPDGGLGYFQHAWAVYGKAGQPCPACPGEEDCPGIQQIQQSGRSTFFCSEKQHFCEKSSISRDEA